MEIVQEMIEADMQTPPDQRTGKLYQQVANSILPMIQLELDCPSLHPNNKIPVLDLEIWMDKNQMKHQFYRKPMANTRMVLNSSALSSGSKRAILMEEAMRRLRNMSLDLPWDDKVEHMNTFSLDLMESGYPENFRKTTLERSISRYEAEVTSHKKRELGTGEGTIQRK